MNTDIIYIVTIGLTILLAIGFLGILRPYKALGRYSRGICIALVLVGILGWIMLKPYVDMREPQVELISEAGD